MIRYQPHRTKWSNAHVTDLRPQSCPARCGAQTVRGHRKFVGASNWAQVDEFLLDCGHVRNLRGDLITVY